MRRVAAPLAAVLAAITIGGCGGDGAEPGAPQGATLVLDFTPNAVHTGIYVAKRRGYLEDEGVELTIREPSSSSDAPKLLEAGRAEFAVLDINDFGIALDRGLNLVPVAGLVDRPLAALIASRQIARPRDLEGLDVGVTGLPSDDAVLDTIVSSDGGNPDRVHRVNIGFNAVSALSAGRVDAATAFWNAEGVALREHGIATREFRVDAHGAPRFPELILTAAPDLYGQGGQQLRESVLRAVSQGYADARSDPGAAVDDLFDEVPELDPDETRAELDALLSAHAFSSGGLLVGRALHRALYAWSQWAVGHGIVSATVPEALVPPPVPDVNPPQS